MKKPYDAGWKTRIISISAEKIFFVLCHALPIDPSSLCRFRKRIGEKGCELILQVTVQAGLISGAVKANSFERVSFDTTVQEKAVACPADARLLSQQRQDKNKLYSLHAPEAECIGKGKAHKKFEFGVKVSVAVTNRDNFIVGMQAEPGNPYDGHTLARAIKRAFVDRGYRGHKLRVPQVFISGSKRGMTPQMKRELGRRSAIEPVIGHMKADGKLGRNHLLGTLGDKIHALLCGAGHNIRLILRKLRELLLFLRAGMIAGLFKGCNWLVWFVNRLAWRQADDDLTQTQAKNTASFKGDYRASSHRLSDIMARTTHSWPVAKPYIEAARQAMPQRWQGRPVRNWQSVQKVWLNPTKEHSAPLQN